MRQYKVHLYTYDTRSRIQQGSNRRLDQERQRDENWGPQPEIVSLEELNGYFWPDGRNRRFSSPRSFAQTEVLRNWRQPMEYPKSAIDPRDWINRFRSEDQMPIFGRLRTKGTRFDHVNCILDRFIYRLFVSFLRSVLRWTVNWR